MNQSRFFYILILLTALFQQPLISQVPEKMGYQAVIRDGDKIISNTTVSVQITILKDHENGRSVYKEVHYPETNINGLISIEIGNGSLKEGVFSEIDWANGRYFIKSEVDLTGGNNFILTSTSELLSVPFAFHAKTSESSHPDDDWVIEDGIISNTTDRIGVGTSEPHSSSIAEFNSENKGVLLPRVYIEDLLSNDPVGEEIAEGLLVYNTNDDIGKGFYFWNGKEWESISSGLKEKSYSGGHNYVSVADIQGMDNSGNNPVGALINAEIDMLSASGPQGKTLYFPVGTYLIEEPIVLKNGMRILGENLRGTRIITSDNFEGEAMIKSADDSYYNNIENFHLINTHEKDELVMIWVKHQWEGSYIKNVHLQNDGVVKGGLWHTVNDLADEGKGGQFIVENLNVFYGDGTCLEESVKLSNAGGLYCRNWNINNKSFPDTPDKPVVSLEARGLILDVSNIHIERTPSYDQPSIKLKGSPSTNIILRHSDIDASNYPGNSGNKVGIEIDFSPPSGSEVQYNKNGEWDIENVVLKNVSGGDTWNTYFDIPIRIINYNGDPSLINNASYANPDKITHIRKFTNSKIEFNQMNAIGFGEGIVHQQTIGTLAPGTRKKINTPHFINNRYQLDKNVEDFNLLTGDYEAKGYLVLISGYDVNAQSIGGVYYVLESKAGSSYPYHIDITEITPHPDIHLSIGFFTNTNELFINNRSDKNMTRVNALIIGTGTRKQ